MSKAYHNQRQTWRKERGQMTHEEREMALEIAQRFIEVAAEIEARGDVLDSMWHRSDSQWQQHTYHRWNEILNSQENQQRRTELEVAFASASDGDHLIRALHSEILRRASVS
jgi:hypothetical protein